MRIVGNRVSAVNLVFLALWLSQPTAFSADTNQILDLSPWSRTTNLRGGAGYKDNVLLSATAPIDSPFWATELEFFLFRIPTEGTQVVLFLNGEDIRFLNSEAPDKEQTLIALASVKKDFLRFWKAGLTAQYLYQDQVFDVSTTEVGLNTVKVQAHGLTARPSLRRDFGPYYAEVEATLARQIFIEPLDDYWEGATKLTLGHEFGPAAKVALSYEYLWRDYETRTARTARGAPISGASLSFIRQDFDLAWQQVWDRKQRWRTTTKLGFGRNSDEGSGYFDYSRYRVSQLLRYVAGAWEAKLQLRFDHYSFPVQTISDTDPAQRTKDGLGVSFQAERKLNKVLKLYAQFDHEQSLSNRSDENYDVNQVRMGVDWTF